LNVAKHGLDHVRRDGRLQVGQRDLGVVLRRDDHRLDLDGLPVLVQAGDLRLAVGARPGQRAVLALGRQALRHAVSQRDRQRHQHVGLAAGVTEHQALVAGAAGVHAHRDVRRLLVDGDEDRARVGVEADGRRGVADAADRVADQRRDVDVGRGRDLAGEAGHAGRDHGLAGDAAGRIVGQDRVHDRVGDLVGHLVRMTFGHRLAREQVLIAHVDGPSPRVRAALPATCWIMGSSPLRALP
jgi:hypothetical protein